MNRPMSEQDEFLLSRLVDDDLPAAEADALRARMEREPELKRVHARLVRLDAMLAAKRADQPSIDWGRFHRQVMDQIAGESPVAAPVVYKLRRYLQVALPLAAAAAIALVVMLNRDGPAPVNLPDPGAGTGAIARNDHVTSGQPVVHVEVATALDVQYSRIRSQATESGIEVHYARSDELTKEYQELDSRNRTSESRGGLVVSTADTTPTPAVPRELLAAAASLF